MSGNRLRGEGSSKGEKKSPVSRPRYPGIRGCQTKMLTGAICYGISRRSYENESASCYEDPDRRVAAARKRGSICVGPGRSRVAEAAARVREMAFVGITELWGLSDCLFHRLLGSAPNAGDRTSVSNAQGGAGASVAKYAALEFIDAADELLFEAILDRFEADLACVAAELAKKPAGDTTRCGGGPGIPPPR